MGDVAGELEAALTSAGTLLVWAEKYRHDDPAALPDLRRRLLEAGDSARRLSRAGRLDDEAARSVLADVAATADGLRARITGVRTSIPYLSAVVARTEDRGLLLKLLPAVFADLSLGRSDAAYFVPPWQRRGRPLPAEQVAADLAALRAAGIAATGDDLAPGVDPELPGVVLAASMPAGVPIAARYDGDRLPVPSFRLGDDQILLPVDRFVLPFEVALAPAGEPLDEWVADPEGYLRALGDACRAHGLMVRPG